MGSDGANGGANSGVNSARVERGAGVAVWRQIEQILAGEIAANGFGDEGRLPSEGELARRFDVNRHTVRRAVMGLAANGLVSIEQGRGTFVQRGAIDYLIGRRTRFTENLRQQHHAAEGHLLSAVRLQADASVAKELALRVRSPVWRIESLHAADGIPLTYACNWYPAVRFPDLPSRLEENSSITHALASLGVTDYLRKWSRIGSVLPDTEIAWRLGVNRQQPVLWVENVDVDPQGVPIKYGITHFAADRVQLMVDTST
ncbi:phosphonate metabolism transcriptional regulator PhnF [Pandoraea anhela]|nr:phosphonate metabolism transcriptional regulator PhnF [Pandoraea anhela]